ncbi:MAG: hypothetical protein NTY19_23555 [Planctomycetota bacterium]|nr:hypothetical protein [Planctomycetota bacterium]
MNYSDPTGKDFTLGGCMATGAIIGGLAGMVGGAAVGAYSSGQLLSFKTLEYGLIGLVGGAAAGALVGASVFFGPQMVSFLIGRGSFSVTLKLAFRHTISDRILWTGFALGAVAGLLNPELKAPILSSATWWSIDRNLRFLTGLEVATRQITTSFGPAVADAVLKLSRAYRGGTFWAMKFTAGFTIGTVCGYTARQVYDLANELTGWANEAVAGGGPGDDAIADGFLEQD